MFRFTAYSQTKAWENINSACQTDDVATLQGFECIFANILLIIIPFAVLAAFIVLIVGGLQYLTSAGDPKQVQKATGTITAAIIGIAVTLGIWIIFNLLNTITGLNLLQFEIPH